MTKGSPTLKKNSLASVTGLVVALTLLSGCLWAPDLDRVRKEIEDQLPGVHFEKEFAISLGPVSMALARAAVKFVPDASEARPYLKDLRRVKVAIYEADNVPTDIELEIPGRLTKLLEQEEWELAAKVKENGDAVWVLYRTKEESITHIYVVVMSSDELVLVQAEGRLERVFENAMSEHGDWKQEFGIEYH